MQKKGGNALGLTSEGGPMFHVLFYSSWKEATDDAAMMRGAKALIEKAKAMAQEKGLARDYIYMPYASGYQEVVAGYGAVNQEKLRRVARKYDPTGVFRTLQPGGFKLDGSPFGSID